MLNYPQLVEPRKRHAQRMHRFLPTDVGFWTKWHLLLASDNKTTRYRFLWNFISGHTNAMNNDDRKHYRQYPRFYIHKCIYCMLFCVNEDVYLISKQQLIHKTWMTLSNILSKWKNGSIRTIIFLIKIFYILWLPFGS